ncbi:MAG: hypothetical protein K0R57_1371 [Paenibacillaceae bacterium]|nr:hypothetical protein [Paenibacillaceae bacterium]
MKTRTKSALTLSLAVTVTGALAAGCSGGGGSAETSAVPSAGATSPSAAENQSSAIKPISLTYWSDLVANASASVTNLGQTEMYKELEKRTGVKVTFKHPAAGNVTEAFGLMIASRDLPDVIEAAWIYHQGGPAKAIEDNIIIPLEDLIDKHAPNLKKILAENPEVKKQISTDKGQIYAFPSLNLQNNRVFGGLLIRKDWLDELGLTVPQTVSEWETALRAFKEKKGAANPFTMDKGSFTNSQLGFMGAYGINNDVYVDNGKVKFGPVQPEFKEFLTTLNKWYKEGLLDPDFATNDGKIVDSKITTGKSGATFGYIGGTIGKYLPVLREKDPKATLVMAQYPVLNKGETPRFIFRDWEYNHSGAAAITTANKNPVDTVKWLDYLYGSEGHMLKNFGVEGLTYKLENGYPKYTDLILNNPDKLPVAQAMGKYFRANYPSPGLADDRYLEQYYVYQEQKDALKTLSTYADNAVKVLFPPATNTPQESEEVTKLGGEISTYKDEMLFKFIMGTEPIANFDKYTDQLKKLGIERVVALKQAALDRYNAR